MKLQSQKKENRRKSPDIIIKALSWLAAVGWICLFIALLIIDKAKPDSITYFNRYYKIQPKLYWNPELTRYIFFLMLTGTVISITGLVLNKLRHRRKNDSYSASLIIISLISISGILLYLF